MTEAHFNLFFFFWYQEAAGEGIPILLLGNKMDKDEERQVSYKEAFLLAEVGEVHIGHI